MTRQWRPPTCESCQYPLRHSRTPVAEAPGTRVHGTGGLCTGCAKRKERGLPGPAAPGRSAGTRPATCLRCDHPLRSPKVSVTDAPGTVPHRAGGLCAGCHHRKERGLPGPALHDGHQSARRFDVDEVAVDLAIAGARVTLNHAERALVIESLSNRIDHHTGRPYSAAQIALMAAVSTRTVVRVRARLREQEQLAA